MSGTKVVATYGPACESPEVFSAMLRAGLDVVRLNVSHLDAIVCLTFHGTTARRVARYRPGCAVYALGPHEQPLRRLALTWGVEAFRFGRPVARGTPADRSASHLIEPAVALLRKEGKLRKGDRVAFLAGIPLTAAGGTNSLRVVTVG